MSVDWDANVLAPCAGVFGEPVTYLPANGVSFSITGVFDEAYHGVSLLEGAPMMTTASPVLGVRLAEFPVGKPPRKKDELTVLSVGHTYTVKDVRPDGHGHILLMLNSKHAS